MLIRRTAVSLALLASCTLARPAYAQDDGSFFSNWAKRRNAALSSQPKWPVPLVTTSARLEECYRFDLRLQPTGDIVQSFGDGKGVLLIPAERLEIDISPPSYQHHRQSAVRDGFTDTSIVAKFRLHADKGDSGSVISVQLIAQLPTGERPNGAGHAIIGPMFLYGKGWDRISVQGNIGIAWPTSVGGESIFISNAVMLRVWDKPLKKAGEPHEAWLWPQLEVSSTAFRDGPNNGKTQTFLTPGLLIGARGRPGIAFGAGVQIAASQFHTYNHAVILSARALF